MRGTLHPPAASVPPTIKVPNPKTAKIGEKAKGEKFNGSDAALPAERPKVEFQEICQTSNLIFTFFDIFKIYLNIKFPCYFLQNSG